MCKYILIDNNAHTEVFTHDDIVKVVDTLYACITNDSDHDRDASYSVQDSESNEIVYRRTYELSEFGFMDETWFMTPEVAKVLEWDDILSSSELPLEYVS